MTEHTLIENGSFLVYMGGGADGPFRTSYDSSRPAHTRWYATEKDYGGPPEPVGTGATEDEAIDDLREKLAS